MEKIVSRYAFIAFICGKLKREYSYISRALPVSVVGIAPGMSDVNLFT